MVGHGVVLHVHFMFSTKMKTICRMKPALRLTSLEIAQRLSPMQKRALFPEGSQAAADEIKVSPGLVSGNHVFLTGVTGSAPDGSMPETDRAQFHSAFEKIGKVLAEAGLGFDAIVEMTTYHVGLRDHFDLFSAVRADYVQKPYPAWTAVEVAGLRREGAVVEIRVIAEIGES
jgi:enamine deaminase RidA (YjgF/YER057c/UK114 family)